MTRSNSTPRGPHFRGGLRCMIALAVLCTIGCTEASKTRAGRPAKVDRVATALPVIQNTTTEAQDPAAISPIESASVIRPAKINPLIVQSMIFRRPDARLDLALSMLDPPDFSPELAKRWTDNGFIVGSLDRRRAQLFLSNLPKPQASNVSRILGNGAYNPLTLVDRTNGKTPVSLVAADGTIDMRTFFDGEYQLLVRVVRTSPEGIAIIDLLPHHFKRQARLVPVSPEVQQMDGTSFNELRIEHPLDDQRLWVITAAVGGDEPPPGAEGAVHEPDPDAPLQPPTPAANRATLLGPMMLSGNRLNTPSRIVLFIGWDHNG